MRAGASRRGPLIGRSGWLRGRATTVPLESETATATPTVLFVGNPNTGKSTLFGALSGGRVRVGNYPGVTVEMAVGAAKLGGRRWALIDLPGTYSLAPAHPTKRSPPTSCWAHRRHAETGRRALRRRRLQPRTQPLSPRPGARTRLAYRRRPDDDRRRRGARHHRRSRPAFARTRRAGRRGARRSSDRTRRLEGRPRRRGGIIATMP